MESGHKPMLFSILSELHYGVLYFTLNTPNELVLCYLKFHLKYNNKQIIYIDQSNVLSILNAIYF